MSKTTIYEPETTVRSMLKGMEKVHNLVASTMGPKGGIVWIKKSSGEISSSKDGATVANAIESLPDPMEDVGRHIIRKSTDQMRQETGDGSTTVAVLIYCISKICVGLSISHGNREIASALKEFKKEFCNILSKIQRKISLKDIGKIALLTIDDQEIANHIANAMIELNGNGIILVNPSHNDQSRMEIRKGFSLDAGMHVDLLSYYTMHKSQKSTDNWQVVFENPIYILINGNLSNLECFYFLEKIFNTQRPVVIVAHEFSNDVILITQRYIIQKNVKCALISLPGYDKKNLLNEVATYVNGIVLQEQQLMDRSGENNISLSEFGTSGSVNITNKLTIISDGTSAVPEATLLRRKERIDTLKRLSHSDSPDFENKKIEKILAMYQNGIAYIFVGKDTEIVLAQNGVRACMSSYQHGVVAGAGVSLLQIADRLHEVSFRNPIAAQFIPALSSVFKRIYTNAGLPCDELAKMIREYHYERIPDATTGDFVVADNIIGPVEVVMNAMCLAVKAATQVIFTTQGIYNEADIKE